jgi:YidC/Oxa1 family membrane protein insertase
VDNQRNMILAIVLSMLVLLGWSALSKRFLPTEAPPVAQGQNGKDQNGKAMPLPAPGAQPTAPSALRNREQVLAASPRIPIRTPRLAGSLNLTGARIDDLVLSEYRTTIEKNSPPVRLLSPGGAADAHYAGFGWAGDGVSLPGPNTVWQASGNTLTPQTPVTLSWTNEAGQAFSIKLSVDANYMFTAEQSVANAGAAPMTVRAYGYVARDGVPKDPDTWTAHVGPIGTFNSETNYDVDFSDLDDAGTVGTRFQTPGGWLGFGDHYWLTALVPTGTGTIDAGFRAQGQTYQADFAASPVSVAAGTTATATTRFFAGAKEMNVLDDYEDKLGITHFGKAIDWGWYEVIEKPIFKYLGWLNKLVNNFGVAIMLLTLTIRLLMFPIAQKQFASMAGMRVLQPKMKALQDRYKDDKPRLQQEMMGLYKSEKINPMAGCLPLLIQIPIFYALYKVLLLTIEMRHAPFITPWINDLAAPDPWTPLNLFGLLNFTPPSFIAIGILAIVLGVTMWLQFKLNPAPTDPIQAQVFSIMPWMMMFVMAPFAAGLQLYWATSNILTIAQQSWLYSKHPALKEAAAK